MPKIQGNALSSAIAASYSAEKQLYAIRYKQGGRTVFSTAMTPAQLASIVKKPDPEAANPGNRRIRASHAKDFATYLLDNDNWVSPGVILRAPSIFTFTPDGTIADMDFGVVGYAIRNEGDINILDGQHRILGFHLALERIDEQLDKLRTALSAARRVEEGEKEVRAEITALEQTRDRLHTERIAVDIQVTDNLNDYRQMFYDIAENALGITASVKARFDTRKVLNRALPTILEHPLLRDRVDLEASQLSRTNPHFLTASHVAEISRSVVLGLEGRFGKRNEREMHESHIAQEACEFFDVIAASFPVLRSLQLGQISAQDLRAHSMLGSALFVRILAGVYFDLKRRGWAREDIATYFTELAKHTNAPAHANSIWKKHLDFEAFPDGTYSPSGRRQDSKALFQAIALWAVLDEQFVKDLPEPEPAPEPAEMDDQEALEAIDPSVAKPDPATLVAVEDMVQEVAKESKARGKARSTAKKK